MAEQDSTKTINGPELERLFKARQAAEKRASEERGAYGQRFTKANEKVFLSASSDAAYSSLFLTSVRLSDW